MSEIRLFSFCTSTQLYCCILHLLVVVVLLHGRVCQHGDCPASSFHFTLCAQFGGAVTWQGKEMILCFNLTCPPPKTNDQQHHSFAVWRKRNPSIHPSTTTTTRERLNHSTGRVQTGRKKLSKYYFSLAAGAAVACFTLIILTSGLFFPVLRLTHDFASH